MGRDEILKCIDVNVVIKNPILFAEEDSKGWVFNIHPSKMLTEFSGSDPSKIIRIAVFCHKNQEGLWGEMTSNDRHVLYGYYDLQTKQIDFVWQKELQCRMCEGDNYWKLHEERGEGKVIRLIYIEYP